MSENPKRRIRSSRQSGIYYRELDNGRRRYEFTYVDSDGRRRWQTVDGGERDAVAARAEVVTKKRRGERVAPSRRRFRDVAEEYLREHTGHLRASTLDRYTRALEHANRAFGRTPISDVDKDDVLLLINQMRKAGLAAWTIRGALVAVAQVMDHAVDQGMAANNPTRRLGKGKRPQTGRGSMRILERDEIGRLLAATTPYWRPLFTTLTFTGLRVGEALGLRWADVAFDAGVIRLRHQLDRLTRELVEPKTDNAKRDVVMFPALAKLLRELRLAAPPELSSDEAFVFSKADGGPRAQENARRAFDTAIAKAGLAGNGRAKVRLHDCRHTFVSLLLAAGRDVVFVSRQVGHSQPSITLNVYSHLFDALRHADDMRAALEASFGSLVETSMETSQRLPAATAAAAGGGELLPFPPS